MGEYWPLMGFFAFIGFLAYRNRGYKPNRFHLEEMYEEPMNPLKAVGLLLIDWRFWGVILILGIVRSL